jgi:hypothetical protein
MPFRRIAVFVFFVVSLAATASADTVRVVVDRALVWTRPGGVSIVMNQLLKDQTAEVVRRVGDWYEIVAPPGSGGGDRRTGFIAATQVVLEAGEPSSARPAPAPQRTPAAGGSSRTEKLPRLLNVDAAFRVGGDDLTRSFTAFTDVFAEAGSIATNYGNRSGLAFDVRLAQPIVRSVGVGVGLDYYLRNQHATVDARVPHPFFFNQLRTGKFETEPLSAHEAAVDISGVWMPPAIGPLTIVVFGGPTIFRVSQTVVTDLILDEQYPYDTVTITGVKTGERKSRLFGYHVGGDVSYFFSPTTGVGGGVRYSHAKLTFDNDGDVTTEGTAGGFAAVAGLRLRF